MPVTQRILLAALCGAAVPAHACNVTATSLLFGSINPLVHEATTSSSTITVTCPEPTSYAIALSPGAGSFAERRMSSGANSLAYNLYADAAYTVIWGDGTGVSQTVAGSASTSGTSHTVYGLVPSQPTAIPGAYADSIVVTVSF